MQKSKVIIWKEKFAKIISKNNMPDAFANIEGNNETIVIIDQEKVNDSKIEIEQNYKLLTFDSMNHLGTNDFLIKVSKDFEEDKIPSFTISMYSTNHVLVLEKHLKKAVGKLESMGFEKIE